MKQKLIKFKEILTIFVFLLITISATFGAGYIKYKIWRAEHPQAKTWTFFIPNR